MIKHPTSISMLPHLATLTVIMAANCLAATVSASFDFGSAKINSNVSTGTDNPTLSWSASETWGADGHDYLDESDSSPTDITVAGISSWLSALEAADPANSYDSYTVTINFYSDIWWADGTQEEGWASNPNLRYSGNYNGIGALSVDSGPLNYPTTGPWGSNIRGYSWISPSLTGDTFTFVGGPRTWDGATDWRSSVDSISFAATPTAVPEPSAALLSLIGMVGLVRRRR